MERELSFPSHTSSGEVSEFPTISLPYSFSILYKPRYYIAGIAVVAQVYIIYSFHIVSR